MMYTPDAYSIPFSRPIVSNKMWSALWVSMMYTAGTLSIPSTRANVSIYVLCTVGQYEYDLSFSYT